MSDLRRDYFVTRLTRLDPETAASVDALVTHVIDGALAQFEREGVPAARIHFRRFGKLRYENQEHSVEVPLPDGELDGAAVEAFTATFHSLYEREYTYRLDAPVEFVGAHVVAFAEVGKLTPAPLPRTGRALADARKGERDVDFAPDGVFRSAIYIGNLLEPGMHFTGPAVIETQRSTIVVQPGGEVQIDKFGNTIIEVA